MFGDDLKKYTTYTFKIRKIKMCFIDFGQIITNCKTNVPKTETKLEHHESTFYQVYLTWRQVHLLVDPNE